MSNEILIKQAGAVVELRFNRPASKNAINANMYAALAAALDTAAVDGDVRVVTIAGTDGIFSSGNDLADFQQARSAELQAVHRFLHALSSFPKVLVAGVAGPAVGVGTTMLLHCDLVLAAPSAVFSLPFVDLGLVPEAASSSLLPALIGHQRAARHLILGDPFNAQTACEYGLVSEVVAEDALGSRLHAIAERIAAKPPQAVRLTKMLLRHPPEPVADRMKREGDIFAQQLRSPEALEAFAAFFEKRPPDFKRIGSHDD